MGFSSAFRPKRIFICQLLQRFSPPAPLYAAVHHHVGRPINHLNTSNFRNCRLYVIFEHSQHKTIRTISSTDDDTNENSEFNPVWGVCWQPCPRARALDSAMGLGLSLKPCAWPPATELMWLLSGAWKTQQRQPQSRNRLQWQRQRQQQQQDSVVCRAATYQATPRTAPTNEPPTVGMACLA